MSHQGFDITFKEFKKQFYAKIGDGTCFDVMDINLLKVALDGLKVRYTERGKSSHYFGKPILYIYTYLLIKIILDFRKRRLLKIEILRIKGAEYLAGFSDRTAEEGNQCFPRIFKSIGREKFCLITNQEKNEKDSDIIFKDLPFSMNIFSPYNYMLLKSLRKYLYSKEFISMWNEKEIENIRTAAYIFYTNYIKLDSFLKLRKFKSLLLLCHYHNEGFIHACKKNDVKVVELQHGLIAREDIFYVMPNQVKNVIKKALFPNEIYVYGSYWKNVLLQGCEFHNSDIKICGYYHHDTYDKSILPVIQHDDKVILVTTQYTAEKHFIDFIETLSVKLDRSWLIYIKPHPFENERTYKSLEEKFSNVKIVQGSLNELIDRSSFLITIFSTTIFDALRRGKITFSLDIPLYFDYVNALTSMGVSYLLKPHENPVDKYQSLIFKNVDSEEFYVDFTFEKARDIQNSLNK